MKEYNELNPVKNLPDCYAKSDDSNNYKILAIEKCASDELKKDFQSIYDSLDIEKATGKTLDMYGEMVGQLRGLADDAKYRMMIRGKIAQNLSSGDYPSVLNAICLTFNCQPSEVKIDDRDDGKGVDIIKMPFNIINSAGLTTGQTVALINRLLPVCVKVIDYNFEGTFELAHSYEDMTVDGDIKGLTDTYENMNDPEAVGGYLGFTVGDENEEILPI